MKHKKLAKFLANALGLALLATPITMSFAGCNKSKNQGVDLYSVDISNYNNMNLAFYDNAIEYQEQLNSTQKNDNKCLSEEKVEAYSNVMHTLGDEYAQRRFIFDNMDATGDMYNKIGDNKNIIGAMINDIINKYIMLKTEEKDSTYNTTLGEFLKYYGKDKFNSFLDSNDYISEQDFINGYISFLNGYYDNSGKYIASNYTRYEDLTDEQINQILNAFEENMSATANRLFNSREGDFKKHKNAVSFDEAPNALIIPQLLYGSYNGIIIPDVIISVIDNLYPADFMYFEQPYVDYWQACIDPLFQENFGYTWTECVELTEDPDLHPINWYNYESYLALLGMTEDDIPMPTIS